jgi:hypothetical protein
MTSRDTQDRSRGQAAHERQLHHEQPSREITTVLPVKSTR